MGSFAFEWIRPAMLWWLMVALPLLIYFHFRTLSDFPRWQRVASLAVRIVVVVLLMLALAGLVLLRSTNRQMIVVAVDQSASIDDAAANTANDFARRLMSEIEQTDISVRFLPFDLYPGLSSDTWPIESESDVSAESAGIPQVETDGDPSALGTSASTTSLPMNQKPNP